MYSPSYSQATAESILRGYDFSGILQEDETIATLADAAVNQDGVDKSTLITATSFGSKIVYYRVTGGTSGDVLFVTLTITTSQANTFKGYVNP